MDFRLSGWHKTVLDAAFIIALAVYILAGVPLAPFHGDESMQIHATRDYFDMVGGQPLSLTTAPPYPIDSRGHLRIINGNLIRFAAGAALHLRGYGIDDLPIEPGWNWGLPYPENAAGGWLPRPNILNTARIPSAILQVLSLIPLFGIAYQLGGRLTAYVSVSLYGLNGLLLLNGRRVMMESAMLCFGLITIWIAVLIVRQWQLNQRTPIYLWVLLPLAAGITLAGKHTGAIFLVAAWLWLFMGVLSHRKRVRRLTGLILTGITAVLIFIGLSPALWNQPIDRLTDLARLRAELLDIQIMIEDGAPMPVSQRLNWIIIQPNIAPLMYYERADFAEPLTPAIAAYAGSGLGGLPQNRIVGVLIWLGVIAGVVSLRKRPLYLMGMLFWFGLTVFALMFNPLPWSRYYVPLIPILALLAGVGMGTAINWLYKQGWQRGLAKTPPPAY